MTLGTTVEVRRPRLLVKQTRAGVLPIGRDVALWYSIEDSGEIRVSVVRTRTCSRQAVSAEGIHSTVYDEVPTIIGRLQADAVPLQAINLDLLQRSVLELQGLEQRERKLHAALQEGNPMSYKDDFRRPPKKAPRRPVPPPAKKTASSRLPSTLLTVHSQKELVEVINFLESL